MTPTAPAGNQAAARVVEAVKVHGAGGAAVRAWTG
jgi:hypothetical protein